MKKVYIIILAVFVNIAFYSCTPQSLSSDPIPQACCGDEGTIPPPPPPPKGGNLGG